MNKKRIAYGCLLFVLIWTGVFLEGYPKVDILSSFEYGKVIFVGSGGDFEFIGFPFVFQYGSWGMGMYYGSVNPYILSADILFWVFQSFIVYKTLNSYLLSKYVALKYLLIVLIIFFFLAPFLRDIGVL